MDRKLSEKAEIERLIRLSESARVCLEGEAARIKQRFDIPARIRGSLSQHPTSWLFGSLDAGNAITVDKPPAAMWAMGLSGRLFGFNEFTMLLPQALMGVDQRRSNSKGPTGGGRRRPNHGSDGSGRRARSRCAMSSSTACS